MIKNSKTGTMNLLRYLYKSLQILVEIYKQQIFQMLKILSQIRSNIRHFVSKY